MTDDRGHRLPYAPGLDGLRGLAVAAVVVFHAGPVGWLPGGFLGVSVFFTLSGYLIGSLALSEVERSGRLALGAFWSRRARRLLPALLVFVVASAVLSRFVELSARTRRELFGGLTYTSNWLELWDGRTYGELFGAASPASHLWSLAIEEQFYVVFPLAVLGAVRLRGAERVRRSLLVGSVVLFVAGTAFAAAVSPSAAYYATPARVPEIAAGVALAALVRRPDRALGGPVGRLALPLGVLALAVAAAACRRTGLTTAWVGDGGLAAFALVSTALVAVAGRPGPFARLLSPAPLVWLGRISYGLYLFHWPVVVVVDRPRVDLDPGPLFVLRVALSLALAAISYAAVEQPIRTGRRPIALGPATVLRRAGAALAVGAVVVALVVPAPQAPPDAADAPAVIAPGAVPTTAPTVPTDGAPDGPDAGPAPTGPAVVVILGDSVPNWMVRDGAGALDPSRVALVDGTSEGCDGAEGSPTGRAGGGVVVTVPASCTGWRTQFPSLVETQDNDVALLVVGTGAVLDRKLGDDFHGPCSATARDWYRADVEARLRYLADHADRVVLALPAWAEAWSGWVNPPDHLARTDCVRTTLRAAATSTGADVVDLAEHLCPDGAGRCRPVRETDGVHLDRDHAGPTLVWLVDRALDGPVGGDGG